MPVELVRIDERLLHGQVVVGWGERFGLERYLVVDEDIAGSDWEKDLWSAGVPAGAGVRFVDPGGAKVAWEELEAASEPAAVLTRDTVTMRRVAETGVLRGRTVNVGVIHDGDGRREATPSVHLSPSDLEDLREIEALGARVEARDLPGSRRVPLGELADAASVD